MNKIVIWDWNGTLLNDVVWNHKILNTLLCRRKLSQIDIPRYRQCFRLPIIKLYEEIGFTFEKEPFEQRDSQIIAQSAKNREQSI